MNTDKQSHALACIEAARTTHYDDLRAMAYGVNLAFGACEEVIKEANARPVFLAVYIGTTNDTNGNPRRGWYVSRLDGAPMIAEVPANGRNAGKDAAYTCWVEEGYNGTRALLGAVCPARTDVEETSRAWMERARSTVHETGRINVTPGEYRDARKLPRVGGAE